MVWNELCTLHSNSGDPWFLTGDFNELVDNSEKSGGPERAEGTFLRPRPFSLLTTFLISNTRVISSLGEGKEVRTWCGADLIDL